MCIIHKGNHGASVGVIQLHCAAPVDLFGLRVGDDDETCVRRPERLVHILEGFWAQHGPAGDSVRSGTDQLQRRAANEFVAKWQAGIKEIQLAIRGGEGIIGDIRGVGVQISTKQRGHLAAGGIHAPETGTEHPHVRVGGIQCGGVACKEMRDESSLQQRERRQLAAPDILYGSIDAAKVRIEPRNAQEKALKNRETWRDMKVGCWYEGEVVPVRQQSTRQKEKRQREGVVLRARKQKYFCDIAEAQEFDKLLWATGCEVGADRARRLVFICDGALWIWNLIARYFPNAVQIVDWYHAVDHLKRIAEEAFPTLDERHNWLAQATEDLWQGRVELVIEACRLLVKKSECAQQSLTYYSNNIERMRYDQFRASNFLIGSGVIESGCKQIVTQRLKLLCTFAFASRYLTTFACTRCILTFL